MKRSEMIEILDKHFQEVCYQDYAPDSNEILSLLEKAGMTPPEIIESVTTEFVDIRPGMLMMTEHSGVYVRKWEPEDE